MKHVYNKHQQRLDEQRDVIRDDLYWLAYEQANKAKHTADRELSKQQEVQRAAAAVPPPSTGDVHMADAAAGDWHVSMKSASSTHGNIGDCALCALLRCTCCGALLATVAVHPTLQALPPDYGCGGAGASCVGRVCRAEACVVLPPVCRMVMKVMRAMLLHLLVQQLAVAQDAWVQCVAEAYGVE